MASVSEDEKSCYYYRAVKGTNGDPHLLTHFTDVSYNVSANLRQPDIHPNGRKLSEAFKTFDVLRTSANANFTWAKQNQVLDIFKQLQEMTHQVRCLYVKKMREEVGMQYAEAWGALALARHRDLPEGGNSEQRVAFLTGHLKVYDIWPVFSGDFHQVERGAVQKFFRNVFTHDGDVEGVVHQALDVEERRWSALRELVVDNNRSGRSNVEDAIDIVLGVLQRENRADWMFGPPSPGALQNDKLGCFQFLDSLRVERKSQKDDEFL